MAFAAPDEHEKLLVEVERLRADKEDMVRRIRERDVRSTEFATKLDAAEKKANKAAEDMAAERSKRYKLDQQLQDANESIDQQRKELRSLIARLEKSTTAHSMALEQLTESQKELAVSRAAASRLDSTCEILRTEREAAQQEAAELLKALAVTDARAAAAKQASVSMMEQMGRERGELSTQRDLAQERLEATQAKLEQERVHRAREEVQIQAGIAADRAEWRAMRVSTLNEYECHLVGLQEQLWQAQAENLRLEGEQSRLESDAARGRAAAEMTRSYVRHCRCLQTPFVISEGRHAERRPREEPQAPVKPVAPRKLAWHSAWSSDHLDAAPGRLHRLADGLREASIGSPVLGRDSDSNSSGIGHGIGSPSLGLGVSRHIGPG